MMLKVSLQSFPRQFDLSGFPLDYSNLIQANCLHLNRLGAIAPGRIER